MNKDNKKRIIKELKILIKNDVKQIKKDIKNNNYTLDEISLLYNQIYKKYGSKMYKKFTPNSVQHHDINFLFKQGRFLDYLEKYGYADFKQDLHEIKKLDIQHETGSDLKGYLYYFTHNLIDNITKIFIPLATSITLALPTYTAISSEKAQKESLKNNETEINFYLDNIKKYSNQIENYNLSDIENIMKVMSDLWIDPNIYGTPNKDYIGCLGLDMLYGEGVCRNIADDISRKLNYINPNYNAHVIVVDYENVDAIEPPFCVGDSTFNNKNIESNSTPSTADTFIESYKYPEFIGNHAVILMNIPENNAQLIVDPTNPSIGAYVDGKIYLFNKIIGNNYSLSRNFIGDTLIRGFEGFTYPIEFLDSHDNDCKLTLNELEELYGIEAQIDALISTSNIPNNWLFIREHFLSTFENINSDTQTKTNSFKESIQVSENDLQKSNIIKKNSQSQENKNNYIDNILEK